MTTGPAAELLASGDDEEPAGLARRPAGTVALVLVVLAVLGVRALVPARFPAVDGDLVVRIVTDATADRSALLGRAGLGGWPRDGSAWVVATARWATDAPVPAGRRACRVALLVRSPDGVAPRAWRSSQGPTPREPALAGPVLVQYAEVLPPDLAERARRGQGVFAAPAAERGDLAVAWRLDPDGIPPDEASRQVRMLVAPVCPDTVHGLVELARLVPPP